MSTYRVVPALTHPAQRVHDWTRASLATFVAVLGLAVALPTSAREIRFARQTSIVFLQLYVLEDQKLVEKHAARLGLKDVKVSWATFNGANAMNDALLSGNVDIVTGGMTGMLILWDKTKGTRAGSTRALPRSRRPRSCSMHRVRICTGFATSRRTIGSR